MMRPSHVIVVAAVASATAGAAAGRAPLTAAAQSPDPATQVVLDRAADYVTRYLDVMSNLTAEEVYVQDIAGIRPMISTRPSSAGSNSSRRELRSDIVLVRTGPPLEWRVYRDVFAVDGRPVRDRADRLARLLVEPSDDLRLQAERIAEEGARFNISNLGRVLNEPGLPLTFLQASVQTRFAFTLEPVDRNATYVLHYREVTRPTLFWHNRTIENPSSGRFWIDAATGEIHRTEHLLSPTDLRATFTTVFRHDDRYGLALPTDMREELWTGVQTNARRVTGVARYSKYRHFAVTTN